MAKIGLVLSGGMVKGAYQIGVLKALKKYVKKEDITYVSASSVGSLAAYSYISDRLEIFEELWMDNESFNIRNFLRSAVKRSNILDKVSKLVAENEKIDKDFFITCLNITKMKLDYINLNGIKANELEKYLKAAISFIPVFKSIEINGSKYLDGAIIDNIPVLPLSDQEYDYLIVVHFDKNQYIYQNLNNKNIIELNFNINSSISSSLSFDMESSKDMITSGYCVADDVFSRVFKYGIDNLEYISECIRDINNNAEKERYNMSGDMAVDRLNNVAKKLIRYNLK
ncbi:MAG: patatin-like phospholipase family protein [Clostridia bacterium]|nr:patatin-like phospholipase family protein [Clostridia bacterium]